MLQIYGFILRTGQKFCNFALMMKKKIPMIGLLAGLCLTFMTAGCDQQRTEGLRDYTVTCTLGDKVQRDSATLLVLEEEYNKLRMCAATRVQDGKFIFKGQIDSPKVALIRWDNDSTHPFHFVLEPGNINLNIEAGNWSVEGSKLNAEYLKFITWRNSVLNARADTWREYLTAASKSSLNREEELRLVRQDSLLNDSLQRATVERINRGDAVGRIIRERYGDKLDQEHARQLK